MADFDSLKTCAMTIVVVIAVALCVADNAWAGERGGFGGCDGWGGLYCANNAVSYAPEYVYYEAIYVEGRAVVYVPRYHLPRRSVIARHCARRHVTRRRCACR
jgi:hypothetical protein